MPKLTRRRLLCATAPLAAAPLGVKLALDGAAAEAAPHAAHDHAAHRAMSSHRGDAATGHAAMIGDGAPAVGGPSDLDALLYPPAALSHAPGRVRDYTLVATDEELEVAPGVFFPAWTYNGTVPGPVIRATEDDLLRVRFLNSGVHPHTIHFHGIHPTDMDGVFEIVGPGEELTYEFPARPAGFHVYHCHATPLKKHIHKGLYGAFINDPKVPREPARELVRAYLANLPEYDLLNSFHLHAEFFRYQPTGTGDHWEYTDTVMQCQGQRGVLEIRFAHTGTFMFHAHQSEFTELGWMGYFQVED